MPVSLPIPAASVGASTTEVGTPSIDNALRVAQVYGIAAPEVEGASLVYNSSSPGIITFDLATAFDLDTNFVFGEGARTQVALTRGPLDTAVGTPEVANAAQDFRPASISESAIGVHFIGSPEGVTDFTFSAGGEPVPGFNFVFGPLIGPATQITTAVGRRLDEVFGQPTLITPDPIWYPSVGDSSRFGTTIVTRELQDFNFLTPSTPDRNFSFGGAQVFSPRGFASDVVGTPSSTNAALDFRPSGISAPPPPSSSTVVADRKSKALLNFRFQDLGTHFGLATNLQFSFAGQENEILLEDHWTDSQFGTPSILMDQTVTAGGIASATAVGTPEVKDPRLYIRPGGITDAQYGSPTLRINHRVYAIGINQGAAGLPEVFDPEQTLSVSGFDSSVVGTAFISNYYRHLTGLTAGDTSSFGSATLHKSQSVTGVSVGKIYPDSVFGFTTKVEYRNRTLLPSGFDKSIFGTGTKVLDPRQYLYPPSITPGVVAQPTVADPRPAQTIEMGVYQLPDFPDAMTVFNRRKYITLETQGIPEHLGQFPEEYLTSVKNRNRTIVAGGDLHTRMHPFAAATVTLSGRAVVVNPTLGTSVFGAAQISNWVRTLSPGGVLDEKFDKPIVRNNAQLIKTVGASHYVIGNLTRVIDTTQWLSLAQKGIAAPGVGTPWASFSPRTVGVKPYLASATGGVSDPFVAFSERVLQPAGIDAGGVGAKTKLIQGPGNTIRQGTTYVLTAFGTPTAVNRDRTVRQTGTSLAPQEGGTPTLFNLRQYVREVTAPSGGMSKPTVSFRTRTVQQLTTARTTALGKPYIEFNPEQFAPPPRTLHIPSLGASPEVQPPAEVYNFRQTISLDPQKPIPEGDVGKPFLRDNLVRLTAYIPEPMFQVYYPRVFLKVPQTLNIPGISAHQFGGASFSAPEFHRKLYVGIPFYGAAEAVPPLPADYLDDTSYGTPNVDLKNRTMRTYGTSFFSSGTQTVKNSKLIITVPGINGHRRGFGEVRNRTTNETLYVQGRAAAGAFGATSVNRPPPPPPVPFTQTVTTTGVYGTLFGNTYTEKQHRELYFTGTDSAQLGGARYVGPPLRITGIGTDTSEVFETAFVSHRIRTIQQVFNVDGTPGNKTRVRRTWATTIPYGIESPGCGTPGVDTAFKIITPYGRKFGVAGANPKVLRG